MEKIKRYAPRVVAALLMLAMLLAAIGYGEGLFSLSFAKRTPTAQTKPEAPTFPTWQLPVDGAVSEDGGLYAAQVLATFESLAAAIAANKTLTLAPYGGTNAFAVGSLLSLVPFSERMTTVATEVRVPAGNGGADYRTELVFSAVDAPVYRLYMGFILYERGEVTTLYSATGVPLVTDARFAPAWVRDASGNPLFLADGGLYLRYDAASGTMVSAVPEHNLLATETDTVACATDAPLLPFAENGRWGYKARESGLVVISATYKAAFAFCKNPFSADTRPENAWLAVVFDQTSGALSVINTMGDELVRAYDAVDFALQEGNASSMVSAFDGCFLPTYTASDGALGMDVVDAYGMIRVRRRVVRRDNHDVVPVDTDTLLSIRYDSTSGVYEKRYFDLPRGYRLVAYTEGMLLLEDLQTGKYGYYSVDGRWIFAPDFVTASPMREGVATVTTENGKMGLCTAYGAWVLPTVFDYVSAPSDGVVLVYDKSVGWRMLCKVE